ncbi:unnamed protein product [Prorocentrum cordatum]|uniref:Uncharacterized protein n=1 Tax=Prorocentrum cordatum TaxID=2364126 RepID=A0ABN9VQ88_9DINO|nr:unnamed protein product [Polarella glacialis]
MRRQRPARLRRPPPSRAARKTRTRDRAGEEPLLTCSLLRPPAAPPGPAARGIPWRNSGLCLLRGGGPTQCKVLAVQRKRGGRAREEEEEEQEEEETGATGETRETEETEGEEAG